MKRELAIKIQNYISDILRYLSMSRVGGSISFYSIGCPRNSCYNLLTFAGVPIRNFGESPGGLSVSKNTILILIALFTQITAGQDTVKTYKLTVPKAGTVIEILCNGTEKAKRTIRRVWQDPGIERRPYRLEIEIDSSRGKIIAEMLPFQQCSSSFLKIKDGVNQRKSHITGGLESAETFSIPGQWTGLSRILDQATMRTEGSYRLSIKFNALRSVKYNGSDTQVVDISEVAVDSWKSGATSEFKCEYSIVHGVPLRTEFKNPAGLVRTCVATEITVPK